MAQFFKFQSKQIVIVNVFLYILKEFDWIVGQLFLGFPGLLHVQQFLPEGFLSIKFNCGLYDMFVAFVKCLTVTTS